MLFDGERKDARMLDLTQIEFFLGIGTCYLIVNLDSGYKVKQQEDYMSDMGC